MFLNTLVSAPGEAASIIKSRAEPSRAEPSRAEPSRAEPSRAEPSRAEPSRAEPSRAEPSRPSRAEPSRAEPSRAEPSRAEPSRAEPSRAEPSRAEPSRAEPSRAEPSRAEPSRAEPSRAEPSRAEPSRAEPSRAEPSRAEPSRAEPSRAEPSRAEPSRAEPSRAEPSRAEPSRAEPSRASDIVRAQAARLSPRRSPPPGRGLPAVLPPEAFAAPLSRGGTLRAGAADRAHGALRTSGALSASITSRSWSGASSSGSSTLPAHAPMWGEARVRAVSAGRRNDREALAGARSIAAWVAASCIVVGTVVRRAASARARVAAAWLVASCIGLGLSSLQATAQAEVLVSNIGQAAKPTGLVCSNTGLPGQKFTTGSNPTGYDLTSIAIDIHSLPAMPAGMTMEVYTNNGNAPNTSLHTLTSPGTLTTGANTFTAPAGASLDAGTSYFVVVTYGAPGAECKVSSTFSGSEGTAASGWSIANERHYRGGMPPTWNTYSGVYLIMINGNPRPPEPKLTTIEVTSSAGIDDSYGIRDEIEVTVTFNEDITVDTSNGTPELALDGRRHRERRGVRRRWDGTRHPGMHLRDRRERHRHRRHLHRCEQPDAQRRSDYVPRWDNSRKADACRDSKQSRPQGQRRSDSAHDHRHHDHVELQLFVRHLRRGRSHRGHGDVLTGGVGHEHRLGLSEHRNADTHVEGSNPARWKRHPRAALPLHGRGG